MAIDVAKREAFFAAVDKEWPQGKKIITRQEIMTLWNKDKSAFEWPNWFLNDLGIRVGRGEYDFEACRTGAVVKPHMRTVDQAKIIQLPTPQIEKESEPVSLQASSIFQTSLVPPMFPGYVPFGYFNHMKRILGSSIFMPVYITGLSGNGKTLMCEEACAQLKRECLRADISEETDEDDLIGGFRLVDGKTVWHNGPVIVAMQRGAVLILDEVDRGTNKIMCIQPVLEGKPIFVKKINQVISPEPGFQVLATANTKGRGNEDGRFIGTRVMNEAFLDRFAITFEQEYPPAETEVKILDNQLAKRGIEDKDFTQRLVAWGGVTRKAFSDGAVSDIISTRRLVYICDTYAVFKDRQLVLEYCLNRFDDLNKRAFFELYTRIDDTVTMAAT
jgi:hypothetical protein